MEKIINGIKYETDEPWSACIATFTPAGTTEETKTTTPAIAPSMPTALPAFYGAMTLQTKEVERLYKTVRGSWFLVQGEATFVPLGVDQARQWLAGRDENEMLDLHFGINRA